MGQKRPLWPLGVRGGHKRDPFLLGGSSRLRLGPPFFSEIFSQSPCIWSNDIVVYGQRKEGARMKNAHDSSRGGSRRTAPSFGFVPLQGVASDEEPARHPPFERNGNGY